MNGETGPGVTEPAMQWVTVLSWG